MKPTYTLKLLGFAALVGCVMPIANAQNLVADPGFEASADLTTPGGNPFSAAWTLNEPGGFSNVGGDPSFANTGNNYANLAPAVGAVGSLSQTISTTIGKSYTFSFFLADNSSVPVNSFSAFFGGSLVFSTTSPPFSSSGTYSQITVSNLIATSTSTLLQFQYRHDDDFWRLDDVSVTAAPEAGQTLWLLVPAVAGLALVHLRLNRRNGAKA